MATRPWSFTASSLSIVVSLAYLEWAVGGVNWAYGLWAIIAIIFFHAAGNTWSDWHDFHRGVDAADTHGVDTLTSGRFSPRAILCLSLGLFAAAIALGTGLMLCTGFPLFWVGLAGFLGAIFYPPLKYRALGDLVIMIDYCILPALGTSYVAIGQFAPVVLWVALPVGLLVNGILHANNTRDMRTDRRANARTLAQVLGVRASVRLYLFQTIFPFAWVLLLIPFGIFPLWAALLLQLVPLVLRNCRLMCTYRSEADAASISSLDQLSAQLQLLFCLVLTSSLMCNIWFR